MYSTLSHTFSSPTHGEKKFYLTMQRNTVPVVFDGKINDDKTVGKFQMKQDEAGQWKIQPGNNVPAWVMELEGAFGERIEEIAARK